MGSDQQEPTKLENFFYKYVMGIPNLITKFFVKAEKKFVESGEIKATFVRRKDV